MLDVRRKGPCRSAATSARLRVPFIAAVVALGILGAYSGPAVAPASAVIAHRFETALTTAEPFEEFNHPWALEFDATGNLYVTEAEGPGGTQGAVDVFSPTNAFIAKLDDATVGGVPEPFSGRFVRSVAVENAPGPDMGDVLVGESETDHVVVLKPEVPGDPKAGYENLQPWTGAKTKPGESGSFFGAFIFVAVDDSHDAHAGDVYVLTTGAGNEKLYLIKPGPAGQEGETVREIQFQGPSGEAGLAVSPITGDLYVANQDTGDVDVFNAEGVPQPGLEPRASETPAKSFTPIDVAVDPSTGEVYVVDAANHVIDEFSASGKYEAQIADAELEPGKPTALAEPLGVAVSPSGHVYVSDAGATPKAIDVYGPEPRSGPTVEGESVSAVTDDSALLEAEINPRSLASEEPTSYRFQYTTQEQFEREGFTGASSVPLTAGELPPSFEVKSVSVEAQGLRASATYHFRVVGTDALGVAEGQRNGEGEEVVRTFTTRATGEFSLPDGREWEMVSPPQKDGALIRPILEQEGVIQAAANGDAITYPTNAPIEAEPAGYTKDAQVLSTRSPDGGWSSRDLATPHGTQTGPAVGHGQEFRWFSEDLSQSLVQPFGAFTPCTNAEGATQPCVSEAASEQTAFLRSDFAVGDVSEPCTQSCYRPLVTGMQPFANVPPGTHFGEEGCGEVCGPEAVGATADASQVVLGSNVALTVGGAAGLYEWTGEAPAGEQLQFLSLLPPNAEHKELPALGPTLGDEGDARQAISSDGSRVFWSAEKHHALYMRDTVTGKTLQLDVPEPECERASECGEGAHDPEFQAANSDGSRAFFTDTQKLTEGGGAYPPRGQALGGADLYECTIVEAAGGLKCDLTDVTPAGSEVGSVLGASEDGSWVYFVANVALAPGAVSGGCPNELAVGFAHSVCSLYVRHDGVTRLVAVLSGEDAADWHSEGLEPLTARVSPDGEWLAFMSQRSLTGYDNLDAVSDEPDEEVYLYHAPADLVAEAGTLTCASCNPTGARPHGEEYGVDVAEDKTPHLDGGPAGGNGVWPSDTWVAANVPGWTPNTDGTALYQSRYLSDSGRLFFNSSDGLVPKDVNGTEDVYEYEPEGVPAGERACSASRDGGGVVFKPARAFATEGRRVEEGAGCVGLISAGTSADESGFLDASENGSDVFFLTTSKLAPQDTGTEYNVFDAQECTRERPCAPSEASQPPACNTEASCKAAPTPQPTIFGPSGSATFSGSESHPPLATPLPGKVVTAAEKRARELAKALQTCKKDRSKTKRRSCEAAARKRYGAAKAKAKKSDHGGRK
jgi:DNA-binding beta-propeller fold protein YncE